MKIFFCLVLSFLSLNLHSQNKEMSISFLNASTAKPFSHFGRLLIDIEQPGFELGYGFNWKSRAKHDWYQEIKIGYIYHRFVQHSIPLFTNLGYRYKLNKKLGIQTSLGLGYLHSIPATAQLKLQSDGEYSNSKGLGRMQGMASFKIGSNYILNINEKRAMKLLLEYQQILQTPFINSYVPLLPYNCILIGIGMPLHSKKLRS